MLGGGHLCACCIDLGLWLVVYYNDYIVMGWSLLSLSVRVVRREMVKVKTMEMQLPVYIDLELLIVLSLQNGIF